MIRVTTAVLKPVNDTVKVYVPGSTTGNTNAPRVFVTVFNATLVASFLATTLAPGTTPPSTSITVPDNAVFAAPCAATETAARHTRPTTHTNRPTIRLMDCSF